MKIAIDVVLLPSPEMTARVIQINRELLKLNDNKIVLSERGCLPHISLCMGVVENADLPHVQAILNDISKSTPPLQLTAEMLRADVIPTGKKVSGLRIRDNELLQKLHDTIMDKLWPYLTYDVNAQMFYNPQEVEEVTFQWVKDYARTHGNPSLFNPHITVGFGETDVPSGNFPIVFSASTLALCQLGNYCTARQVLGTFRVSRS